MSAIWPVNLTVPEQPTAEAVMGEILNVAFHRGDSDYDSTKEDELLTKLQTQGIAIDSFRGTGANVVSALIALAPALIKYIEDMRVNEGVGEAPRPQSGQLCQRLCQQRVTRQIERHAQRQIGGAL